MNIRHPKVRAHGSAVILVLVITTIMMMLLLANGRTVRTLTKEVRLIEQRQTNHWARVAKPVPPAPASPPAARSAHPPR